MLTIGAGKKSPIHPVFFRLRARGRRYELLRHAFLAGSVAFSGLAQNVAHAESPPRMLTPKLAVRTVTTGLDNPTTMAFLGTDDMLVLEKNTGRVQRVTHGTITGTVLDLPVNAASERGLLGIALHPEFAVNHYVYLFWTESATADDTDDPTQTPVLGNRVDRFVWTGSALERDNNIGNVVEGRFFGGNLIKLRALQQDEGQPPAGNHNGGVIAFGPDGKLYVFLGDLGRRGELQNLPCGPTAACPGTAVPDDSFGGPEADVTHLAGVVLRLNENGTTPTDNPFFVAGAVRGGEAGPMLQKVFSYGHRNSFGMAFDPKSGRLWLTESGGDAFSELNLVKPGMNGGWIQVAGPIKRIAQFKAIETGAVPGTCFGGAGAGLQQTRWPAENIADSRKEARLRFLKLRGSSYSDPKLSWKYDIAPAALGFVNGQALGKPFKNDLFMGAATPNLRGGYLFHFDLSANRQGVAVPGRKLRDRVADNRCKLDLAESERLLIGEDFGIVTDLRTGPNGNLFVVSHSRGAIYEIAKAAR